MNVIQTSDTTAVRRLETREQQTAVIDPEVVLTMGMNMAYAHSVWTTADNGASGLLYVASGDEDDGDGWLVVLRGPIASGAQKIDSEADGLGVAAVSLVDAIRAQVGGLFAGVTVPRSPEQATALERWKVKPGNDWDLMVCDQAPPLQPNESLVRDGLTVGEVQAFLDRVNPHHSVRADDSAVDLWAGIRDERGGLLAVGALTRRRSGVGYLASIATDPVVRGKGYGSAVTAYLTRRVFDADESQCTLAHYHPNESARRIYLRLGYRTIAQNYSCRFA